MLEEAVGIIAELFAGGQVTHHGRHYTVETARLYSGPEAPPPIYVSGFGEQSAGWPRASPTATSASARRPTWSSCSATRAAAAKPVQGGLKGCWAPDAAQARATLRRLWPSDFIPGESAQLLPTPRHFSQLAPLVTDDMVSGARRAGPEAVPGDTHAFEQAGFDEVYLQQVGGNLEGAFEFFATEVLPRARGN